MTKTVWMTGAAIAVAIGATAALAHDSDGWGRGERAPGHGMMDSFGPHYMGRRFCEAKDSFAPRIMARLETSIRPTDTQKSDFDQLKAAASKAEDIMKAACPSESELADRSPPARLALAEKRMTAALEALKTIQTPFDSLYAKLDDKQRDRLRWMGPRHG
jgi:hypothetical protein